MSEKEPESENGYYMYFKDVAGNRFGIYELKKKQGDREYEFSTNTALESGTKTCMAN